MKADNKINNFKHIEKLMKELEKTLQEDFPRLRIEFKLKTKNEKKNKQEKSI